MWIGDFDRRISIEQPTETRDAFGGVVQSWSEFASRWAKVQPVSSRERFTSEARREVDLTLFTIRYLPGVTVKMRIQFDGKTYQVLGFTEVGRRLALEVLAEVIK